MTSLHELEHLLRAAWHPVLDVLPPDDVLVEARQYSGRCVLWRANLMRHGLLWFTESGQVWRGGEPTHWREVRK